MPTDFAHLRRALDGLQAFVCTPFDATGALDLDAFRRRVAAAIHGPAQPAGCFVACGAGEFFSLTPAECTRLVAAAAAELQGRVPLVAGVGHGTALAVEAARAAMDAGADALLLFPPYLTAAPQAGLLAHVAAVARAVEIGVIVYHRDNAVFSEESLLRLADIPTVIGVKDGHGNLPELARVRSLQQERLLLINGMPSAEMYAPAYFAAGIRAYSSGVVDFLPDLAWAYYRALVADDQATVAQLQAQFFRPYTALRGLVPGYGIALVKAALALLGEPVGGVRPPLQDSTPDHRAQLAALLAPWATLVPPAVTLSAAKRPSQPA